MLKHSRKETYRELRSLKVDARQPPQIFHQQCFDQRRLLKSWRSQVFISLVAQEPCALPDLYSGIPPSNSSKEVQSAHTNELAVLSAGNLGWSDLGDPARVLSVLERKGVRPEWKVGVSRRAAWVC